MVKNNARHQSASCKLLSLTLLGKDESELKQDWYLDAISNFGRY